MIYLNSGGNVHVEGLSEPLGRKIDLRTATDFGVDERYLGLGPASGKTTKVNCAQSSTIKSNNFQLALFGLIGPKNQFGCFDRQKYDGP
jgi:hypothetical protein